MDNNSNILNKNPDILNNYDINQNINKYDDDNNSTCKNKIKEYLKNNVKVGNMVGQGGFSKVYVLENYNKDKNNKQDISKYVIKIMDINHEDTKIQKFKNEKAFQDGIKNQLGQIANNINKYDQIFSTDDNDCAYIIMEKYNITLKEKYENYGVFDIVMTNYNTLFCLNEFMNYYNQLSNGVRMIHSCFYAHADVITENIIIKQNYYNNFDLIS